MREQDIWKVCSETAFPQVQRPWGRVGWIYLRKLTWLRKHAVDMNTQCPGDQQTASSSQLLQGVPQLQRATLHQVPSHGSTHPMAGEAGIKVFGIWASREAPPAGHVFSQPPWSVPCSFAGLLHILTSLSFPHPTSAHFFPQVLSPNE